MLVLDVQKKFPNFQLNFQQNLQPGVTAFFGQSGVGKTTLLNMIAGLVSPDAGRIVLNHQPLFDATAQINLPPEDRGIGYVFQESRLFPHLNVQKNLCYGYRKPKHQHALHFQKVVDLLELERLLNRYPNRLSGGEKQRVAIGRALLRQPNLLLMDEPLASLDAQRKTQILPFLKRVCGELEIPILYVTHLMDEIMHLAHGMAYISEGQCVLFGPLMEVLARHDVQKFYGLHEIGSLLETTVLHHDTPYDLTVLAHAGGPISIPIMDVALGEKIRIRVLPRDVILATTPPLDSSALNVLKGTIASIDAGDLSHMDILLDVGSPLWARVTRKSCDRLNLEKGKDVYAVVKSAAVMC